MSRFWRATGHDVLHPMGFDAFGLPAEEYAIKTNTPPRESTERDIANFTRQLKMLGFSYDWDRKLSTTDVDYFGWTQWIFLVLYDTWFDTETQKGRPISELPIPEDVAAAGEKAVEDYQAEYRLAFQSNALVNWCPGLGTVLANEEVIDGKSERGSHPVKRIPLRQWMLRITSYADRLESELEGVDWPTGVKKLQTEWIGRSQGAEVDFYIGEESSYDAWQAARKESGFPKKSDDQSLRIYTTRPDTLFGATYMVIAPEHPFVEKLTTADQKAAVDSYCEAAAGKSDRDRTNDKKEKTGVFSGSYAVNPCTGKKIPIWIADYVLIGYGTGAIMAVPAHDDRDFEFAKQFNLEVIPVLDATGKVQDDELAEIMAGNRCYTGPGKAINSGQLDGKKTGEAKKAITYDLSQAGIGKASVNYKLRDWLFSRQRFWGEPFPILHELGEDGQPNGRIRPLQPEDLPLDLPHLEDYKPHGKPEPPLGKAGDEWLYVELDGKRYKRETNTMPQWAGSCWYYLRYIDNKNKDAAWAPEKENAWMPVDLYIGGAEHAVLHLLYARFWHKVLYDRGYVSTKEPFQKLVNQGMILGEAQYFVPLDQYEASKDAIEAGGFTTQLVKDDEGNPESYKVLRKNPEGGDPIAMTEADTDKHKGKTLLAGTQVEVRAKADKMSKSRNNVVTPDAIVEEFGADSLRLYEMFMGPLKDTKPWISKNVNGVKGFLDRTWRMVVDFNSDEAVLNAAVGDYEETEDQRVALHKTIKGVTADIEAMSFNTAIAKMMEFVNFLTKESKRPISIIKPFLQLLNPFAPHICEELWEILGEKEPICMSAWPKYEEKWTVDSTVEVPVQIKGKVRAKIKVAADISKDQLLDLAKAEPKIAEQLDGKKIVKEIVVPGRLVNFVTAP